MLRALSQTQTRKPFIAIAATIGTLLALTSVALYRTLPTGATTSKNGRDLRYQPDSARAENAALRLIANDLRRSPDADLFTVRWSKNPLCIVGIDDPYDRSMIRYQRRSERLTSGNSGASGGWDEVHQNYIMEAVESGSLDQVLKKHACPGWP